MASSNTIKFKKFVEELAGTEYYLSLHVGGHRIGGSFNFMYDTSLAKYADYKVLDANPTSEGSTILIVDLLPPPVKANTPPVQEEEVIEDGGHTREESPKQNRKVSARVRRKKASDIL